MSDQPKRDLLTFFGGSRPSSLRVEWRSDGTVRLRIEGPGCDDAMVDLDARQRSALTDTLIYGAPEDSP